MIGRLDYLGYILLFILEDLGPDEREEGVNQWQKEDT